MYAVLLLCLFAGVSILVESSVFQHMDNLIILGFEQIRMPFLNHVMLILTDFGVSVLLVPIMLIFSVLLFVYKRYHSIILLLLLYLVEKTVNHELKGFFERARPSFDHLVQETYYSFPSGHSMNAATIYPFMAYLLIQTIPSLKKRKKWVVMVTTVFISFIGMSRMYIGVHYLTDVIGGFSIGLCLFLLFKKIDEKIPAIRQK
ncbi:phosphatase PAP2 family protein [Bacillus sp. NPDC077027]|uniref:phosphatase PAP2 family protein n=1 Tax=Bacillus sp. NPDC077027 TaxID=3390548 RepID=UPI003D086C48